MVLVLDDDHLDALRCSKCRKYLSVFPVKNHATRDVTCGRCPGGGDDDGVRSVRYELIAGEYLFKCVNRYEGCRRLLRADETTAHEIECVGGAFECPKCRDGARMSVLELIWHYKVQHPASHLRRNSFEGKVPTEDAMLYIQDDVVFVVTVRYVPRLRALLLNAATLTMTGATQTFLCVVGSRVERTEERRCEPVGASKEDYYCIGLDAVESIYVTFDLKVSRGAGLYDIFLPSSKGEQDQELLGFVPQEASASDETFVAQLTTVFKKDTCFELDEDGRMMLFSKRGRGTNLACTNCKRAIRLPLFRCRKSQHQICNACRTWCGICDCEAVPSDSNDSLVKVISLVRFPCKWECGGYFSSDLHTHESSCDRRDGKCPECSSRISLRLMQRHLLDEHGKRFCEEYDPEQVSTFIQQKSDGSVYFLLNDKWCRLTWSYILYGYNQFCELEFVLLDIEKNVKLGLVHADSKRSYDTPKKVVIRHIPSYRLYLNFNAA